ncbi:MAG: hypothetical protein QM831_07695 [Kofleriaceae bacterium]
MPKPIAAVPAVLLIAISVWEIAATQHDAHSVPGDDAWQHAAAIVNEQRKPDDLIVFAPDWVDPVGRMHVTIPIEMAARMDSARFPRIWEMSIRGAHAPETAGLQGEVVDDGPVRVTLYSQPAAKVTGDLLAMKPTGPATNEIAEVGFAPHHCWQVIPQPGKPATVTFPQMTMGSKLVGYVGLADIFKRRDIRTPGTLEVHVGNATTTATAGVDDGWVRFEVPTTPGTSDVTFIASATQPDRLICFTAEARQ